MSEETFEAVVIGSVPPEVEERAIKRAIANGEPERVDEYILEDAILVLEWDRTEEIEEGEFCRSSA